MSQEQEETEDENNPPGSLEPELEPESEPGTESEQNERPGPGSEGANNEFEFYFQFTKPLVLYLPSPDERAIAAAWVQKLESRPVSAEEKQLRLNYLKLLLFVLQRGHLTGIFRKQPPSGALQPFPQGFTMMDMGNLMIDQSEAPGSGGGDTRAVPYTIEISNDLREFVAAQEIPNFGVQMYYAWSADEPVYKWNLFNENNFPNYIIEKIKLLKETKSEEKGGILDKICKKKPCDIPLLERIPKSKVKSPEEIEQTQARSYQTYVGLVGRMGNPYKGVCDDDQDKYNKQEQRKCRGQRTKKGMGSSMPLPMAEALGIRKPHKPRIEDLGAYYRPQGQSQGHVVCRCPPTFHLPNCEVRRSPVERWQTPNVASNASGLTTTAYMRGERPEQVEDCPEMPAPDPPVQESPYVPRMRPTSRESERLTYRGPLTKKPVNLTASKKSKSQSLKSEDVSKRSDAVASKKGGPPSKPSTGKCVCSSQQCTCPCPRGPPPKGKRQVQPTSQPISQPTSQPISQPTSQPTSAGQSNVPEQGWCPPQQPPYGQLESSAPLPEWAKRGLIQQGLLNPVTGEFFPPDMKYCYPPNQGPRPARRRWKTIPPEQRQPPCLPRDPSPCVPAVPSQQMNRREDKMPATPGPSTVPTSQREEIYPTAAKPTQKSLPGPSGTQRPGPFAIGTGGRLADMAGILAEIKQKTEAHKIKCKPVATRMQVEPDVRGERIPVTPEQSQPQPVLTPQTQLPYEQIPHCSTQTTTKTVPVHQPTATASKYGGATFTKAPRRPDYWDMMERRRRGQRIAKDLFGGKEALSKGTLEGIEPLGEDGECISESDDDFIDSSSSLECIDDQDRTLVPQYVPDTPEQDTCFSQPTLIQDTLIQNQPRPQRFYTSTPKEGFTADMSSILHCGTGPSPSTLPPGQSNRREQITPDFPYEPFPPPPGATYCGSPDPRAEARRSPVQNYTCDPIDNDMTLQDNRNQRAPRFFASTPKDSVFPADLSPILNCSPLAGPYASNGSSHYNSTPSTLQAGSSTLQAGSPTLQAGSPTLQAGSSTLQTGSSTLQPLTPTLQASYLRRGQQCTDFPFEPMPPSPGGTYYGTPDPRQNQEFVPVDIYQQRTPVQYLPRSPDECIANNEAPPYYMPSPVCSPELESSFPSGAFSSTLTPGTPSAQVTASDVRSRRSPDRRNRSTSRGTPRRENIWVTAQGDECENETPRRDATWATMHGELMTESERAAFRRRDNTWATMHGELITDEREAQRSRRDDTWATMHGEICDEDW